MKWGVICRVVYQSSSHTVNVHSHPPGRRMINVLISPAGTEIDREILLSLRYQKAVKLFLAGSSCDNHAQDNNGGPILSDAAKALWRQAYRALNLLYDIPFFFPAHSVNQVAVAWYLAEKSTKKALHHSHRDSHLYYKFRHRVNTPDNLFSPANDNVVEVTEYWQLFIKPNGKKYKCRALTINDKRTPEIQLSARKGLPVRTNRCGYEYRVGDFAHEKYGDIFCQPPFQKGIHGGLSLYPPFIYEHHKMPVTVMRTPTTKGQRVKRQRRDFFGRANHLSRNDKILRCIDHTNVIQKSGIYERSGRLSTTGIYTLMSL